MSEAIALLRGAARAVKRVPVDWWPLFLRRGLGVYPYDMPATVHESEKDFDLHFVLKFSSEFGDGELGVSVPLMAAEIEVRSAHDAVRFLAKSMREKGMGYFNQWVGAKWAESVGGRYLVIWEEENDDARETWSVADRGFDRCRIGAVVY